MIVKLINLKRDKIRFVIISVLPEYQKKEINELSKELYDLSGSVTALLYPPHITLRTGAIVPIDKVNSYIIGFRNYIDKFLAKRIEKDLIKFDKLDFTFYYDNETKKNIIAYFIKMNPWLKELNKTLDEYNDFKKSKKKKKFNPHISLAYDDLSDDNLVKCKNHINSNKEKYYDFLSFKLSDISLFYQRDDGYWDEFYTINLGE